MDEELRKFSRAVLSNDENENTIKIDFSKELLDMQGEGDGDEYLQWTQFHNKEF